MIFQHWCYSVYAKILFLLYFIIISSMYSLDFAYNNNEGMIINECVIAFTLRMNIWED